MMKQAVDRSTSAGQPVYSIRETAGRASPCAACGHEVTGGGPIGYRDEEPVCDPCLLEGSADLGMMVALVAVTRACAVASGKAPEQWLEPLRELGYFARVYELFAAKSGPMRGFRLPGFTAEDAAAP